MEVVIIGNGISGITAARWIRKLGDHQITVISSESDYFFSRTALMYIYMGHMTLKDTQPYEKWFWKKNRIKLKKAHIDHIDYSSKCLTAQNGEKIGYDALILALGSRPNKFGWPGQDLEGVRGLYTLQDLEYMESFSSDLNRAVIVGGGLIGIEMAEMFHTRKIPVTMLVREQEYWDNVLPKGEAAMVSRHIRSHGVDLRLETNLDSILPDSEGRVRAVKLKESGEELACGFVGLTAGVHPNVGFLKETGLEIKRGILVNEKLESNIPDVYAIGDCAELRTPPPGRRAIEAVWYAGRTMGKTVAHTICGKPENYDPGIWFNSAKFMDIEYQVYGEVPTDLDDNQETFYWESASTNKSIRIVYNKSSSAVIGFNLMGVRFRHEVCEKWIREETPIDQVMHELELANFDPEFSKNELREVIKEYNAVYSKNIHAQRISGFNPVFKFLNS